MNDSSGLSNTKNNKKAIIIHHTASDRTRIQQDGIIAHLQNIYKFHTQDRKRGDIWYHFLIDDNGNIYEGRAGGENIIAAHTKRNNPNTIGISLVGNFEEEEPTTKQVNALIKLTATLLDKYHIDPDKNVTFHESQDQKPYIEHHDLPTIIGHQDTSNTSCPWKYLYEKLDYIRNEAKKQMLTSKIEGNIQSIQHMNNTFIADQTLAEIKLPFHGYALDECKLFTDQLSIHTCTKTAVNTVTIQLKQNWSPIHGTQMIVLKRMKQQSYLLCETTTTKRHRSTKRKTHTPMTKTRNQSPCRRTDQNGKTDLYKRNQTNHTNYLWKYYCTKHQQVHFQRLFSCDSSCNITNRSRNTHRKKYTYTSIRWR